MDTDEIILTVVKFAFYLAAIIFSAYVVVQCIIGLVRIITGA
jgi:hypothetical protein